MIFQKKYKTNLSEELLSTNSGEIEVKLNIAPVSTTWFLLFEPGTVNEETCYYHRILWSSAFIYAINRDNPVIHAINSAVMLTNSIDALNYILSFLPEWGYIFKKSTSHIIITWWNYYINGTLYNIAEVDTSLAFFL